MCTTLRVQMMNFKDKGTYGTFLNTPNRTCVIRGSPCPSREPQRHEYPGVISSKKPWDSSEPGQCLAENCRWSLPDCDCVWSETSGSCGQGGVFCRGSLVGSWVGSHHPYVAQWETDPVRGYARRAGFFFSQAQVVWGPSLWVPSVPLAHWKVTLAWVRLY